MKVIFLDIDGVLNSAQSFIAAHAAGMSRFTTNYAGWDKDSVARLGAIILQTGAKVVVSSTWRLFLMDSLKSGIDTLLPDIGSSVIVGKTPHNGFADKTRGSEIAEWLANNPVDQYVIIDDDSDLLPSQIDNFVQTSWKTGLQDEHMHKAIAILNLQNH